MCGNFHNMIIQNIFFAPPFLSLSHEAHYYRPANYPAKENLNFRDVIYFFVLSFTAVCSHSVTIKITGRLNNDFIFIDFMHA